MNYYNNCKGQVTKNSKYKVSVLLIIVTGLIVIERCSIRLQSFYHPIIPPPTPDNLPENSPTNISLWLVGFFNSESVDGFKPEIIDYSPMFDINNVHLALNQLYEDTFHIQITEPPTWLLEDISNVLQVNKNIQTTLQLMDKVLKTGKFPADFQEMFWIDIRTDEQKEINSSDSTVVCVVIGLETLIRQKMGIDHLRSGLGVILFHDNGRYIGMSIREYNFMNYTWSLMVADISINIDKILGFPAAWKVIKQREQNVSP